MSRAGPLEPAARRLDPVSIRVAAYARQERSTALEAAQLHVAALKSDKVPILCVRCMVGSAAAIARR